jgi:WD40 repeat protein
MSMMYFLSYSRADKEFVRALHKELIGRDGAEVWVDWEDLRAFDPSWRKSLLSAIEACDTFIFIMSYSSVNSGVCAQEVAHAVLHGKYLAVVVYEDVPSEAWKEKLPWIDNPQWFHFSQTDTLSGEADRLLAALSVDHDYLRMHTRFYLRAREWEDKGDESLLIRDAELRNAEAWLQNSDDEQPRPTTLHRRYLQESRRVATRDLSSRLIEGAELASQDLDLTLAVLLAREAFSLSASGTAERILRNGLKIPRVHFCLPDQNYRVAATISQDGRLVAVTSGQLVRIYNMPQGEEIATLNHTCHASRLEFSPSGRYIMTWENGLVRIWNLPDGGLVAEEKALGRVMAMKFDTADLYAAAGDSNSTAILFDLSRGYVHRLKHDDAVVSALSFDPKSSYLITAQAGASFTKSGWKFKSSEDHELWVWSLPHGRRIARIKGVSEVDKLETSPEGGLIVADCSRGQLRELRAWKQMNRFGKLIFTDSGRYDLLKSVAEIAFHPLFWWEFAVGCKDNHTRRMYATEHRGRRSVGESYRTSQKGPIHSVAFQPSLQQVKNDSNVMATTSEDFTVREWRGEQEITRVACSSAPIKVRYTSCGSYLITCTEKGGIYVWRSNHDQPDPATVPTDSLLEELNQRVRRDFTACEWERYFGGEPSR